MGTNRYGCASASVGGQLNDVGGIDRNGNLLLLVKIYDQPTSKWKYLLPMSTKRCDCAAAAAGGKLLFVGGQGENYGNKFFWRKSMICRKRSGPILSP